MAHSPVQEPEDDTQPDELDCMDEDAGEDVEVDVAEESEEEAEAAPSRPAASVDKAASQNKEDKSSIIDGSDRPLDKQIQEITKRLTEAKKESTAKTSGSICLFSRWHTV